MNKKLIKKIKQPNIQIDWIKIMMFISPFIIIDMKNLKS